MLDLICNVYFVCSRIDVFLQWRKIMAFLKGHLPWTRIILSLIVWMAVFVYAVPVEKLPPRPLAQFITDANGETVEIPNYIHDDVGIMTPEEQRKFNYLSDSLYALTNVAMAIAIVKDIGDYDIRDFGLSVARQWGVGGETNEGVFTLIVMDKREFTTEIGIGAEGYLTDLRISQFQNAHLVPHFKQGNYGAGLLEYSYTIAQAAAKEKNLTLNVDSLGYAFETKAEEPRTEKNEDNPWYYDYLGFLLTIGFFLLILLADYLIYYKEEVLVARREKRAKKTFWQFLDSTASSSSGGGRSSGGSRSSGSSRGFGGGRFGGGGSRGGW